MITITQDILVELLTNIEKFYILLAIILVQEMSIRLLILNRYLNI
uniref:Uncharacterized protein n=1 Tax=virus sp. ctBM815 TaxID=2825806 RepID=A0A8S5RK66_9VIRU|nr:MAG TPA: hypothetical protein [virus sp. ctBM815]